MWKHQLGGCAMRLTICRSAEDKVHIQTQVVLISANRLSVYSPNSSSVDCKRFMGECACACARGRRTCLGCCWAAAGGINEWRWGAIMQIVFWYWIIHSALGGANQAAAAYVMKAQLKSGQGLIHWDSFHYVFDSFANFTVHSDWGSVTEGIGPAGLRLQLFLENKCCIKDEIQSWLFFLSQHLSSETSWCGLMALGHSVSSTSVVLRVWFQFVDKLFMSSRSHRLKLILHPVLTQYFAHTCDMSVVAC